MNLLILLYLINFVRTLVIILAIYLGIRLIRRYILPMIIDKGIKNMQEKMHDQQRHQQKPHRPEGDVTIETPESNSRQRKDDGEYVDFEEVD